jgi:hypothetical protein
MHLSSQLHGRNKWEDHNLRLALGKTWRPYLKNNDQKNIGGDMAQVVQYLPQKHDVLSSNPISLKQNKTKNPEYALCDFPQIHNTLESTRTQVSCMRGIDP